ncbi:MAG: 23S rRNA (pseudouridine(1915)-N(3))-methyltransferase RlmH [Methanocorpusculum sp.]|nr:23S rRNA (pseudouridine(1915)-N(3))-methyltransferase RlmH [Methanocorpusculum sp.]MDD2471205.1 23S rRNA (pseudouridine(1915)-N(3))-methyltransferase RlmH [Methanocorpusculum sp.]MDD3257035.1 23S rRNA (pseudouridine(1915)-N(3))-methyltransferase RlmH [Methanocorpusculum sp.]MDD4133234.1 23S rRNA (pseudouridine(1915)-N(3))-methyltransferase RlmH [Methanocorpusculum sp.]
MQIQILCVGKIKDAYISAGIAEFEKRLRPYAKVFVTELSDVKIPENASASEELHVKEKEGEAILSNVKEGFFTIALDPFGMSLASEAFSGIFGEAKLSGMNLCFIIGGPLGLSSAVLKSAGKKLSLSQMTFTHTLCRLILFEQIYRAFRILHGEPYHK